MSYRPNPGTECCPGNVNRFFPLYCGRMYLKKGRSLAAVFYGESEVSFGGIKIQQKTAYPFEDTVRFVFQTDKARKLSFKLRIPAWCETPSLLVNEEATELNIKNGFAALDRIWENGDEVVLNLPATLKTVDWGKNGVFVERGPLLFTYGMHGNRQIDRDDKKSTKQFPAYNIYPDKKWNYALDEGEMTLSRNAVTNEPWSIENAPMTVTVKAKEVAGWELIRTNKIRAVHNLYERPWKMETKTGDYLFTPPLPTEDFVKENQKEEAEELTLVPYACAKVRLTVFPKAK